MHNDSLTGGGQKSKNNNVWIQLHSNYTPITLQLHSKISPQLHNKKIGLLAALNFILTGICSSFGRG
jgi:hypothetical protein